MQDLDYIHKSSFIFVSYQYFRAVQRGSSSRALDENAPFR